MAASVMYGLEYVNPNDPYIQPLNYFVLVPFDTKREYLRIPGNTSGGSKKSGFLLIFRLSPSSILCNKLAHYSLFITEIKAKILPGYPRVPTR